MPARRIQAFVQIVGHSFKNSNMQVGSVETTCPLCHATLDRRVLGSVTRRETRFLAEVGLGRFGVAG